MLSPSSAKAGSSVVNGFGVVEEECVSVWEERKEDREGGRNGVVGRGGGGFVVGVGSLGVDIVDTRVIQYERRSEDAKMLLYLTCTLVTRYVECHYCTYCYT